jgi:flavorubredoxin
MPILHLRDGISWVGVNHPQRRLFDALIPLPEGTSYNAYVVRGRERVALLDTVEPEFLGELLDNLAAAGVTRLDYVVAHHAEQDHSGSLPVILERFPTARLVASPRCLSMLADLLDLPAGRALPVEDGASLDLGGRTLSFLHAPWVHWPETMLTHVPEERLLFTCDLFGSHKGFAVDSSVDWAGTREEAARYFGTILLPFRTLVRKHLARVEALGVECIAPSHGPAHGVPALVLEAYRRWVAEVPASKAVVAFVSMHGSTERMARHLADALLARGVQVELVDLARADLGALAAALLDAATLALGAPAVLNGPHPVAASAATVVNALKPGLRQAACFGSFGWGAKHLEAGLGLLPDLKLEWLPLVACKGAPRQEAFAALDALATEIARKHEVLDAQP